tara:strand:- start:3169 stop:3477 length:309 start_codon:yes stop_codon:yes gene_type:complete
MSYSQIANASRVEREIQWLEYQREYEKRRVQEDFTRLMNSLNLKEDENKFESVMKTLKSGTPVKKSWADMVEDDEANGWVSGWVENTRSVRGVRSWAEAVRS